MLQAARSSRLARLVARLATSLSTPAQLVGRSTAYQPAATESWITNLKQHPMDRILIVNADDFGQSAAITRGIVRAHEQGIVTSTSLMVRCPAAAEAVKHAAGLDLGLHIDLGE